MDKGKTFKSAKLLRSFATLLFLLLAGVNFLAMGATEQADLSVRFGESHRNYLPGATIRLDVFFRSKSKDTQNVTREIVVGDSAQTVLWRTKLNFELASNQEIRVPLLIPVPQKTGNFQVTVAGEKNSEKPLFQFEVVNPQKPNRLKKILVYTPDWEEGLNQWLKKYDIKAPMISWGQVLLFGKRGWDRYAVADAEVVQMVDRALKREMSVLFIDFGPVGMTDGSKNESIALPFGISVTFHEVSKPEQSFVITPGYKNLGIGLSSNVISNWNGWYGVTTPAIEPRFDGKGVKIHGMISTVRSPFRYPLVEIISDHEKGKLYLCQLITESRIDESAKSSRNQMGAPAFDPATVQFLLNLLSATVGDNLLKGE